jgi:hypothetical protein
MRLDNRSAKLMEKAVTINPAISTTLTEKKTLKGIIPSSEGIFETQLNALTHEDEVESAKKPTQLISHTTDHSRNIDIQSPTSWNTDDRLSNLSFSFEDSSLHAHIQITNNKLRLRYEIKEIPYEIAYVDTTIVIQPTEHKKQGFFQSMRLFKSVLFWILIAALIGFAIGRFS